MDTPYKLLDKFTRLSISLPEDATTWYIHLCSSYLSNLSTDLVEHITTESEFVMPNLITLTTNALQLEDFCNV